MKVLQSLKKERITAEAARCLLCYDAPCSKACPNKSAPSEFMRSLYFENERGAVSWVMQKGVLLTCIQNCEGKYCEKACVRGKLDRAPEIKEIHEYLAQKAERGGDCDE